MHNALLTEHIDHKGAGRFWWTQVRDQRITTVIATNDSAPWRGTPAQKERPENLQRITTVTPRDGRHIGIYGAVNADGADADSEHRSTSSCYRIGSAGTSLATFSGASGTSEGTETSNLTPCSSAQGHESATTTPRASRPCRSSVAVQLGIGERGRRGPAGNYIRDYVGGSSSQQNNDGRPRRAAGALG
jgi:hypothetical protein